MKQILQNLKTGETELVEVPCPRVKPGHLLIRTNASLISAGTERMLMEFGQASWVQKARQQPDKVRQVLDKIKTDGLISTFETVQAKLDQPLPLEKVDKAQVKRLLADLLQIRAPKTVEVTHAVISGIFTEANELGCTEVNPAHGLLKRILPSKKKRVRSEPDPFNRQDLGEFLEAAWAKLPEPFPLILEVMAMSAMRLGEALAMSGDNLDSRNRQYNVTGTTRAGRFGPPKSGKRLIDLDEALVDKLEVHIKKMRKEGMAEGKLPGRYLFPGITQRMIQRAMQRACKAAQVRVRNPHDLRHTYATMLLMGHYSPAYVQKQLGPSFISITVDIYGHWIPGEGKMDLTRTLRGPKAKPGNPFTLVQGQE